MDWETICRLRTGLYNVNGSIPPQALCWPISPKRRRKPDVILETRISGDVESLPAPVSKEDFEASDWYLVLLSPDRIDSPAIEVHRVGSDSFSVMLGEEEHGCVPMERVQHVVKRLINEVNARRVA